MNTNNKHPHFSRTVLHNGEERVKRIFRDQLAELAGLLDQLDPEVEFPRAELGSPRGRQGSARERVVLPYGWLDSRELGDEDLSAAESDVSFYPLTFPMILGPGTITTIIVFAGQASADDDPNDAWMVLRGASAPNAYIGYAPVTNAEYAMFK